MRAVGRAESFGDLVHAFARGDDAAAVAEYAIVACALALPMMAVMALIGNETGAQLTNTGTNLSNMGITPP